MFETIMLNEKQIKNYQNDGYVIPDFKMAEADVMEIIVLQFFNMMKDF